MVAYLHDTVARSSLLDLALTIGQFARFDLAVEM
jgi:hypothetical protein